MYSTVEKSWAIPNFFLFRFQGVDLFIFIFL